MTNGINMKKVIALVLSIMLIVSVAGCSTASTTTVKPSQGTSVTTTVKPSQGTGVTTTIKAYDPSDKYMAVIMYPSSNPTVAIFIAGVMKTAAELGYKPMYIGGDTTDAAAIEQMVDSAIAQYKIAGIVENISTDIRWKFAQKFADAGIPAVAVWSEVKQGQISLHGVDPKMIIANHYNDSYTYGWNAAKAMGEKCGGTGTIGITQNNFNTVEDNAARGFKEAIAKLYPKMIVLPPQAESTDVTVGIPVVTSIIQANFKNLVGGFSTTGGGAQTWSKAAKATGWKGTIIGMDATSINLDVLENGEVFALVAQPMFDAWAESARHLDSYLRGDGKYNQYTYVNECPIIYKADVQKYRDKLKGIDTYKPIFVK